MEVHAFELAGKSSQKFRRAQQETDNIDLIIIIFAALFSDIFIGQE